MLDRLTNLVEVIAFLAVVVVVVGLFGRWHFALDLASHFRLQSTVTLVIASPVLYLLRRRRWAAISGVALMLLVASLGPFLPRLSLSPKSDSPAPQYRLLTLNVLTSNLQYDLVINQILESGPDFVILQETSAEWIEALDRGLGDTWPHRQRLPRSDNFGIALYSKLPWETCRFAEYSHLFPSPSIVAEFTFADETELRLIATHPLPSMNRDLWDARNSAFAAIAREVRESGSQRTIVAGDLNCTPWSFWFKKLLRDSGLRNSAAGNGLGISWRPFRVAGCGLPIDHVLVGSGVQLAGRSTGGHIGSDHRPVIVDFNLD
jgi:endonuclease/exonuclease/phosphatase (EEP) superfamily protein YafD